jgi:hypothetical protein
MAEIKSALELALERSKRFVISEEEREKIKAKEILQKATGLFNRFREGTISTNEVMKEIERMDEKTAGRVKEILLSQWADHLALDSSSERVLDAFKSITGRSLDEVAVRFDALLAAYRDEVKVARQKVSLELAEALKTQGIDGDAVEPNVEGSEAWKERIEKISTSHQERLAEIRNALKSL